MRDELLKLLASMEPGIVGQPDFPLPDLHRVYEFMDAIDLVYRRPAIRELLSIGQIMKLLMCENDAPLFGIAAGHLMFVGFSWVDDGAMEITLRISKRLMVDGQSLYRSEDLSVLGKLLRRHEAALN